MLRPRAWIKQNHLDKVGSIAKLTKDQLGIDADVRVMALKPVKLDYSNNIHENSKPIITIFTTHSDDMEDYTFKDQYGHKEIIQSVSGHPFYSVDRQKFVPIGQFNIGEHMKGSKNKTVVLSSKYRHKVVSTLYNFEVYQKHNYMVGDNRILVHNMQRACSAYVETTNQSASTAAPVGYVNPQGLRTTIHTDMLTLDEIDQNSPLCKL